VIPKAALIALPSACLAAVLLHFEGHVGGAREFTGLSATRTTIIWAVVTGPLITLLSFRTNQALGRFWDGTGLLHAMRGEWFDSASCLATFTFSAECKDPEGVRRFRHTLVRLMSLCHGSALDELRHDETESYEVLDIAGLDDTTIKILTECKSRNFNRVEVLLHMIQVLVIDAQQRGVISVPPPILSRVYQTLSRGFVNLLNAKKIKDVRFPFPYAQVIAVLLLLLSVFTPFAMTSMFEQQVGWCVLATFVPVFGFLCLNYTAEELEMPFGEDHNDLPLAHFQSEMNSSLLMLIHECSDHVASIGNRAQRDFEALSHSLHYSRISVTQLGSRACNGKQKSLSVFSVASEMACEPKQRLSSCENRVQDDPVKEAGVSRETTTPGVSRETTTPSALQSSNNCSNSVHAGGTAPATTPKTRSSLSRVTTQNTLSSAVQGAMTESAGAALSSALTHKSSDSENCGLQAEHVDSVRTPFRAVLDLPAQDPDESGLDDAGHCGACLAFCQPSGSLQAQVQEVNQSTVNLKKGALLRPFFHRPSSLPARLHSFNAAMSQPVEVDKVELGLSLPDVWMQDHQTVLL